MSLEKIRLDYENESGFTSAKILRPYLTLSDKDWAIISERYAQQRVNEVLNGVASTIDQTKKEYDEMDSYSDGYNEAVNDCLESILKLKNNEK